MAPAPDTLAFAAQPLKELAVKADLGFQSPQLTKLTAGLRTKALLWGGLSELTIPTQMMGKMGGMMGGLNSIKGAAFYLQRTGGNWTVLIHYLLPNPQAVQRITGLLRLGTALLGQRAPTTVSPKRFISISSHSSITNFLIAPASRIRSGLQQ